MCETCPGNLRFVDLHSDQSSPFSLSVYFPTFIRTNYKTAFLLRHQALTLIHHPETTTSYKTPRSKHLSVAVATFGLFLQKLSPRAFVKAGRLVYSLSVLYLVSFDSGARLSSGPPRPLQASFTLAKAERDVFWNIKRVTAMEKLRPYAAKGWM